jgi:predicted AAA+ superfamily ATPase
MFKRAFHLPLNNRDSLFVFGPRGTGKTKWLKTHLRSEEHLYFDLLDAATFRTLLAYPERLCQMIAPGFKGWIVIDEVQKNPALLDEVHRLIEQEGFRFILTGSSARKLKRAGVNLLAGRALRYRMHPLILQELEASFNLEHALTLGMLPATYTYGQPGHYLSTYVHTYLREEVMQEGFTRNISSFTRFLEIASFSQGSMVNYTEIAREVGIDRQVVANYFSILNDLLLSNTLPAFTKRAKRRLITTDKFYYFDAGVYQTLRPKGILDAPSESTGVALETLFYQSLLAIIDYEQIQAEVYYWRTTGGVEVDFVVYGRDNLIAFEIKHSKNITPSMIRGLRHFKEDYPMSTLYVIYLGTEILYLADKIVAVPFEEALRKLPDWLKISSTD